MRCPTSFVTTVSRRVRTGPLACALVPLRERGMRNGVEVCRRGRVRQRSASHAPRRASCRRAGGAQRRSIVARGGLSTARAESARGPPASSVAAVAKRAVGGTLGSASSAAGPCPGPAGGHDQNPAEAVVVSTARGPAFQRSGMATRPIFGRYAAPPPDEGGGGPSRGATGSSLRSAWARGTPSGPAQVPRHRGLLSSRMLM